MNNVHNSVSVAICADAEDALNSGYDYTGMDATGNAPAYNPIQIDKVVVVQKATQEGRSTVDFIMHDATGKKFVFMITGRLLQTIAGCTKP